MFLLVYEYMSSIICVIVCIMCLLRLHCLVRVGTSVVIDNMRYCVRLHLFLFYLYLPRVCVIFLNKCLLRFHVFLFVYLSS